MLLIIRNNYEEVCHAAAEKFVELIRKKPNCILGLATGSTPFGVYRELVEIHKEENLDLSLVPATMAQVHWCATIMIDRKAATELTQAKNIAE